MTVLVYIKAKIFEKFTHVFLHSHPVQGIIIIMWIVMCLQWQNLLLPNNNFTLTSRYRSHLNCVCTRQPDNFHRWKPPNNRAIGVLTKWISLCRGVIEKKFLAVNDVRCDWQTKNYLAWNVCYYDYNRSPTLFDLYTRFTMYSFQAKGIGPLLAGGFQWKSNPRANRTIF